MTTVYYVDLEGGSGTKDGSSFANRAGTFSDLGSNSTFLPDGDHEVRVKRNPTRSLGQATVKRRGGWFRNGYDGSQFSSSNSYWVMSTTTGESMMRYEQHGLATGDVIEIVGNRYYWNGSSESATHGDGSGSQQSGNYIGINGIWTVDVVDSQWFKLREFTATFNKGQNDGWPSGFQNSQHGRWYDVTGCTVVLDSNSVMPIKELMPESNRSKFVASSNTTTYDVWCQQDNWSGFTNWTVPEGANHFEVQQGAAQGLCAYYETPNTLDLSTYQGISMEVTIGSGSSTDWRPVSSTMHGRFSLRLCTDTAGQTSVHTIPIDTRAVSKHYSRFHVKFDTGGNMNAAIKSIAIYKEHSGNTSNTFRFKLSNIIAYKTAASYILTHFSHIGFGTTDNPNFYCIKYFKNDGDRKFIRLQTDGNYFRESKDDYGYYGGGMSVQWKQNGTSLTTTGTIYAMESFPIGYFNTPTSNIDNNNSNQSWQGNFSVGKFGSGTSASPKLISGGWDATNMSTAPQSPLDNTVLSNHAGTYYQGWYQNGGSSNYQTWKNFIIALCGIYGNNNTYYRFENLLWDNCTQTYFTSNNTRGIKNLRIHCRSYGGFSLMHGTHSFSNVADGASGMSVSMWGFAGQDYWRIGENSGFTWSEVRSEAGPQIQFDNQNYYINTTIQNLITGLFGRQGTGVTIENTKAFTIGNWESTYNSMSLTNNAEVTINDFTFEKGSTTTKHGTYPTSYASYCISWSSDQVQVLSGTTNRRINFSVPAKINNIVSTDSQEHTLGTRVTVLSANHNGVSGAGKYLTQGWTIEPESTIRHTASGTAWKMTKTSSSYTPKYEIAKVAVAGSGTVTVKLWVYRTVTGTNTFAILRIPADATLGVTKSEMNSTNGGANQWYELTATATPSSAGIMSVELELSDTTNSGFIYFDDMTITQT